MIVSTGAVVVDRGGRVDLALAARISLLAVESDPCAQHQCGIYIYVATFGKR